MPDEGAKTDSEWIIEPSKLLLERDHVLVARTLCQQKQVEAEIPVELYNPSDEPVQQSQIIPRVYPGPQLARM